MFLKRCLSCLYSCVLATCSLAAVAGPSAPDAEVDRYERLIDDIRDFDRYDNAQMNDLIFAGLHSDNPRVVELTIAAMNRESAYRRLRRNVNTNADMQKELGKLARDLARVPGVRDFLVDYAREGLAEHGWKAVGDFDFYESNLWDLAFGLLVDYFPGDPEVRHLLHASFADNPDAGDLQHYQMNLLNAGLFVDEEADDLRMKLLVDPNPSTAGSAARGLAMSVSGAGLEAMANVLWRRDDALPEIAVAMASYGARAAPHTASLRALDDHERESLSALRPSAMESMLWMTEQVGRLGAAAAADMERRPASGAAGPRSALPGDVDLQVDDAGVPIVTRSNWRGETNRKPLDFALQLYDAYPQEAILDAVFNGLYSGDDVVVEQTVIAVGFYAHIAAQRDWPSYFPDGARLRDAMDTRMRRLDEVPGLRGFLLSYAKRGMNPASCRARGARRDADMPPWMLSVVALAVYFPGNAEVRDMVLDMGRCLDDAGADESVLPLLAVGRFRGEAVERRRLAGLTHRDPVRAGWAAQGLGWSLTDAGLAALAAQLSRQDEALSDIVAAMACYGSRAAPHLPALRALAGRRGNLPDAAFERIASATAKIAQLAAP